MNAPTSKDVQVTADGLVHLRLTSPLARQLGIETAYDRFFDTPEGAELSRMAQAVDPVYEPFNLVRYAWFAREMADAAARYPQLLLLGSGYDTRSLTWPSVKAGTCRVFELDHAPVLAAKQQQLRAHGVALPGTLSFVGCDLNIEDPLPRLVAAGFDPRVPSAAFMEGMLFFLRPERALALISPDALGLLPGSLLTCDVWTPARARALNAELVRRSGRALFGEAAFGADEAELRACFQANGYAQVDAHALEWICARYGVTDHADPIRESWFVIRGVRAASQHQSAD